MLSSFYRNSHYSFISQYKYNTRFPQLTPLLIPGTQAVVLGLGLVNQREKLPADILFCQIPGILVNLNQISTPLLLSITTIERIIAIAFPVK